MNNVEIILNIKEEVQKIIKEETEKYVKERILMPMNKKIYKGYELIKAIEDGQIEEGTILTFTSTIAKDNKKEVEVIRRSEGLVLFKKDTHEILPTSWLFNSKIEVLEDNTEEIEEKCNFENMGYEIAQAYFEFYKGIAKALTEKRKESEDNI